MRTLYLLIFASFLLLGCSGYQVRSLTNPFSHENISSICVPTFINNTSLPFIAPSLAQGIISVLEKNKTLRIMAGRDDRCDAFLVGFVLAQPLARDTIKTVGQNLVEQGTEGIGSRSAFYVPSSSQVSAQLRLVLVRQQLSKTDLEMLADPKAVSPLLPEEKILDVTLSSTTTITLLSGSSENLDEAGSVSFTKNQMVLRSAYDALAKDFSNQFQELVLNAF